MNLVSTLYSLRITYLTSTKRARVRNVRNLTWLDVEALVNVLHNEPSTLGTHATAQVPVWQRTT